MSPARGWNREYGRLEALLAEAGLSMPPIPDGAEARLKEREEWSFSTRAFKESPLNLHHYVRKAIGGASPDYVLVARVRRGAESYAMHYFLVQGSLQVFLQLAWQSSAGRDRSATSVNECFSLAHDLVGAAPRAIRAGHFPRAGRLTVVGSDFAESFWEVAAAGEHPGQGGRRSRGNPQDPRAPRQVLEDALRWCRGAGSVT